MNSFFFLVFFWVSFATHFSPSFFSSLSLPLKLLTMLHSRLGLNYLLSFSLFSSQAKRDFLNQANDILSTSPGEDILLQLLFHSMMLLLLFCLPVGFLVFFHFSIFSRLQNNNQNFLGVYFKSLFLSLCDQIYIRSRLKMQKIRKNLQTSTLFIANCMPKKEKESFFLLIRINFRNRQRETEVNSFS